MKFVVALALLVVITAAGISFSVLVLQYNDTTGWTGGVSGMVGVVVASLYLRLMEGSTHGER